MKKGKYTMKPIHKIWVTTALTASLFGLTGGMTAQAAEGDAITIDEIIVSAQKRDQSIQDVPIAISAYDANFIEKTKLDDVKDMIDFTPGFAGKTKDSFVDAISIRGIVTNSFGAAVDPSVGIFKDGVYQGRTGSAITSFFDVERTEALRGPQGFLFGRNASSGAVSIMTKKPDPEKSDGYVHAGLGERNHIELDGAVNIPLNDQWAVRVAGYYLTEDGYVNNIFYPEDDDLQSQDKGAGRISLGYRGDRLDMTLIAEYENRKQSGSVYRALEDDETFDILGVSMRGARNEVDSDLRDDKDDGNVYSFTALLDWDLNDMTLSSITGVRTYDYQYAEDFDGAPFRSNHYFQDQEGDYYSQEIRLVSSSENRLTWYAGVSAYQEEIKVSFSQVADEELMCAVYEETTCEDAYGEFTANPNGLVENNDVEGTYKGWGAYVDVTYAATDKLELSVDLRYTYDKKDFGLSILPVESELGPYYAFGYTTNGFVRGSKSWDDFTPRFVARYAATDDLNLWASITRGYKSGGFGSFGLDIPTGPGEDIFEVINDDGTVPDGTKLTVFEPETLWSYEAGLKANMVDNRVQMAVNAYYYDFKNLQVSFFDEDLNNTVVENVGQVDGYGVEATLRALPSEYIDMLIGAAYSKTDIQGTGRICDDCDGNRLTNNPEWTFTGVINGHYPVKAGEIFSTLEFRYQSKVYGGFENEDRYSVEGYANFNLRTGYESDQGWNVSLYVENLFNQFHYDAVSAAELPIPGHNIGPARPRTFGIDVTMKFGD
ncbi:TonB-dependent receptor [Paremcibacter congregatus]|uniref:TonB-dependent receptor n=1 Tax=Paremcibacter congregatus TaxID=2043170 RepID=UPI0030EB6A8E|tara:strand:+ start:16590 stop:18905 length:2316 start_codon:yes stop_codon:yes gene_type:complete